jgi:hypothetical protein
LEKSVDKIDTRCPGRLIYVFRSNKRGLYALTADPEGRMLPSQLCPENNLITNRPSTWCAGR